MTWSSIVAGGGIGLLLGFATGMSTSPLVATVVAAVLTLLGAILGFKETAPGDVGAMRARQFGVGAFGVTCALGMATGVFMRAHDVLAETPAQELARWRDASFDSASAHALVAYRLAGIVPQNATITQAPQGGHGMLFGAAAETCERLDPARHPDYDNLRTSFALSRGPWAEMSVLADSVGPLRGKRLLTLSWTLACAH